MSETPTTPTELDAIPSQEEWLIAEDIQIDHTYQRPASDRWVKKIADNFDPFLLDSLIVNRRADGSLYVMDGQHRLLALRRIGYGDQKVPCRVYDGLPLEMEAKRFNVQDVRKVLLPAQRFRAALQANDGTALLIQATVRKTGWKINLDDGLLTDGRIAAVAALVSIQKSYRPGTLEEVLSILADAFGTGEGPRQGTILGVARFCTRFRNMYDRKRLVETLGTFTLGRLHAEGMDASRVLGKSNPDGFAFAIWKAYNHRLSQKRRLPEWTTGERKAA